MPIPLEANPDVMNVYIRKLGVPKKVQVVDVLSIEEDMLDFIPQPVHALMLLFPCEADYSKQRKRLEESILAKGQTVSDKLFFVRQFVRNVCGTMALIHSIANIEDLELEDGPLKRFITEALPLDPVKRGELLQDSEVIDAHIDASVQGQTSPPGEHDHVPYAYLAFVQKEGSLYELDGANSFPINLGFSTKKTFLRDAAETCRQLMKEQPDNINFTICAVPPEEHENVPYHYLAFVQKEGSLYELDGSKRFPINLGPSSEETFLRDAAEICRQRIREHPNNVNFTICAVVYDD